MKLTILESDKDIPDLIYDEFPDKFTIRMRGKSYLSKEDQRIVRNTVSEFMKNAEDGQVYAAGGGFGSTGDQSKFKVVSQGYNGLGLKWLGSNRNSVKMTRSNVEDFIFNGAKLIDIEDSPY